MSIHPALQELFNSFKTKCSDGTSGAELCYNSDSGKGFINYFESDGTSANIFVESIDSTVHARYSANESGNAMFECEYPIGSTDADSMVEDIVNGARLCHEAQETHALNEADDVEHLRAILEMGYGPTKPILLEGEEDMKTDETTPVAPSSEIDEKVVEASSEESSEIPTETETGTSDTDHEKLDEVSPEESSEIPKVKKPEPSIGTDSSAPAKPVKDASGTDPSGLSDKDKTKDKSKSTGPGIFEKKYPKLTEAIKKRLATISGASDRLLDYLNKDEKRLGEIESENPKLSSDKPMDIDNNVKFLVDRYNNKASEDKQINLEVRGTEPSPEPIGDLNKVPEIEMPAKLFNRPPVSLDEACATMRFGYPVINFGSDTIKDILRENDEAYVKSLIKEFVKEVKGTKILVPLKGFFGGSGWKGIRDKIRIIGSAKCFPCVHKPLKINGSDINTMFEGDAQAMINVHPINTKSSAIKESVDNMSENALLEANGNIDGNPVPSPISYLAQFYTVAKPQTPEGMAKYTRYMSQTDLETIQKSLSPEDIEAAKKSGRPLREALLIAYVHRNNGRLPYYILVQRRSNPKEKIRISQKPFHKGMYIVKSIDPVTQNKIGYFVDKKTRLNLFELG